ncbi:hypothetical protein SELMODRAFT_426811 [Selaginella moellendorffii]|uniref:Pre-mRNA-splicing factor SLU7 n=1 Tax=Selaginella moellendorffii TaxID=88036 RepID=D8SXK2_SELML|nr:hypothetical protein SELMODRAFT_426811 [Selaginella moellendorffii]
MAPSELDEDSKEINPHIPQFMSAAPWYVNEAKATLKHQHNWKSKHKSGCAATNERHDRGRKTHQATKYRKGACQNCGAMTHDAKACLERPRTVGAKWTNKSIAADEEVESLELDYDGKSDRWNGYDPASYSSVIEHYERRDEARSKFRKVEQLKKMMEPRGGDEETSDEEDHDHDEAKVDESKQMDFARVEKRVKTAGGGSTGTVKNLRIREDQAKYLKNLDPNSAHFDAKSRSMREDPLPSSDPSEKFYAGDNQDRMTGEARDFQLLNIHAMEAYAKGQGIHPQAAPSQAELHHREFKMKKEKLKQETSARIKDKYGNAACEEKLPVELLLGQTETQVQYDRAGRVIKGSEGVIVVAASKYEEDVFLGNHTSVWGSFFANGQWGFKCCWQFGKNSYCTWEAGIAAAQASAQSLLRENLRSLEGGEEIIVKRVCDLDEKKLEQALERIEEAENEEKDERKRKYNAASSHDVFTAEDLEAYRIKRVHSDDPMIDFL